MMRNKILQGDVIELVKTLKDESVNCVITSPPYFGLRNYKLPPTKWPEVAYAPMAGLPEITIPAVTCCLGLEDSIEAYVGHMVLVFRELWRVLRGDGVAWLNLGDSYSSGNRQSQCDPSGNTGQANLTQGVRRPPTSNLLKPKDLCGTPWRVAFALQSDGWYLRSDIIWAKKNCMPESVTDRPTKAHEYLFMLAKSERYYYDQEAIREPIAQTTMDRWNNNPYEKTQNNNYKSQGLQPNKHKGEHKLGVSPQGRNKRTVWTYIDQIAEHNELFAFTLARLVSDHPELLNDILDEYGATTSEKTDIWKLASQPLKAAHFAVMPEALVEPCLLAGCPAQVCIECGEPWVRQTEKSRIDTRPDNNSKYGNLANDIRSTGEGNVKFGLRRRTELTVKTLHFTPTCQCCPLPANKEATRPGIALDPFLGSGTVGVVAEKHKRDWLGIELNPEYAELARARLEQTQPALFAMEA